VGYDIYFVRRDPGETFEDALESTEDTFQGDPGPLTSVELEQWERLVPRARVLLGDVEEFGDETSRELSSPAAGILLSLVRGEASIAVRPGPGSDALTVMERVYALARIVEDETGLEGYDPQLGAPVSAADDGAGSRPAGRRDASTGRGDEPEPADSGGSGTTAADGGQQAAGPTGAAPASRGGRRWWELWKQ
jgi:hypothetical protein